LRALVGLWGLTLVLAIVWAWRRARASTFLLCVVLGAVLIGVLASRPHVVMVYRVVINWITSFGVRLTADDFSAAMQFGHIALFAGLSVAILFGHRRWQMSTLQALASVVVIAIATEALQRHAFGRNPDVQDFIFDVIGIALGYVLYKLALFSFSRRQPVG